MSELEAEPLASLIFTPRLRRLPDSSGASVFSG